MQASVRAGVLLLVLSAAACGGDPADDDAGGRTDAGPDRDAGPDAAGIDAPPDDDAGIDGGPTGCAPEEHLCAGECVPDDAVETCGERCTPCPGGERGTTVCEAVACSLRCDDGALLCGGRCIDPTSDSAHCGGCDRPCADGTVCRDRECGALPCPAEGCPRGTWCDASADLCRAGCASSDDCGDGERCDLAIHACVCAAGFHPCGAACAPDASIDSCGASCTPCPAVVHGRASCDGATCGFDCDAGYHACMGACLPDGGSDPCSCRRRSCDDAGAACGRIDDGCGGTVDCGGCDDGLACVAGLCGGTGGPGLCIEPGWCWEHPLPADLDLNAVLAFASDDVWVGGEDGVVLRWDGDAWTRVPGRGYDVWHLGGTGPTDLWASGLAAVSRWDGAAWVDGSGGDGGAIASSSPDDAWAAIRSWSGDPSRMTHWDGTGWTVNDPRATRCEAVAVRTPDDVWAGCWEGHVHWNGRSWTLPVGGPQVRDYAEAPGGDLLALTWSSVQRYDGADWVAAGLPAHTPSPSSFTRLSALARDHLWFAGAANQAMRYRAGVYESFPFAVATSDVAAVDADDVWVVGFDYLLGHYDGSGWETFRQDAFTGEVEALADGTHGARWAVGPGGLVVRFDGERWLRVTNADRNNLHAVWASSPGLAWAVGDGGTILRCEPAGCSRVMTDFTEHLYGIWGADPDAVWAVGASGRIARYDGSRWARIASPTATPILAIHGRSRDNFWIVGAWAIEWDGTDWIEHDIAGAGRNFLSVHVAAPDDVWITRGDHWMSHWNGTGLWISRAPGGPGSYDPVVAVFGSGDRTRALLVPSAAPGSIHEWDGSAWNRVASAPYTLGAGLRYPAALLPDGSMRFLRTRDNFRGSPGRWKPASILFYDPDR